MGRARGSLRRPVGAHLGAKMGQVRAKMALSWPTSRQDVAKMAHMDSRCASCERFWEDLGDLFWILGAILPKLAKTRKTTTVHHFCKVFGDLGGALGGYVGSSWRYVGLCWAILAPSLAILADLALKLRPSWQDVSTKIPKMS